MGGPGALDRTEAAFRSRIQTASADRGEVIACLAYNLNVRLAVDERAHHVSRHRVDRASGGTPALRRLGQALLILGKGNRGD